MFSNKLVRFFVGDTAFFYSEAGIPHANRPLSLKAIP